MGKTSQSKNYSARMAGFFLINSLREKRQGVALMKGVRTRKSFTSGQRSVVKVTWVSNAYKQNNYKKEYKAQWKNSGSYLARKGAQKEHEKGVGFDEIDDEINIAKKLEKWQLEGDERLYKIIVSPERGADVDLKKHTRELMQTVEKDLGTKLEYVAIDHYNTLHPHVHLVIRGKREDGTELKIGKEYFTSGFRTRSQEILTRELGLRTELDIMENRRKMVFAKHITDLDRMIDKVINNELKNDNIYHLDWCTKNDKLYQKNLIVKQRLEYLEELGVASKLNTAAWYVNPKFIDHLRYLQEQDDIIKSKSKHINNILEKDLPVISNKLPNVGDKVIGKVVGSGLSERTEERYILLEGTDKNLHNIQMNTKIAMMRDSGQLSNGMLVEIRRAELVMRKAIEKEKLSRIEGIRGTIFDPATQGSVWEKATATEVRLREDVKVTDNLIKSRISGDFEKAQDVLKEAQEYKKINYLKVNVVNEQKQTQKLDPALQRQQTPKVETPAVEPVAKENLELSGVYELMVSNKGKGLVDGKISLNDRELAYMINHYSRSAIAQKEQRESRGIKSWEDMSGREAREEFYRYLQNDLGAMAKLPDNKKFEYMINKALDPNDPMQGFYQTAFVKSGAKIEKDGAIEVTQSVKDNVLGLGSRGLNVAKVLSFDNQDLQQELMSLKILTRFLF